jgi:hypothetical protein
MKKEKRGSKKKKGKKVKRKISWNYIFSYGNNLALNSLIAAFLVGLAVLIIFNYHLLFFKQVELKNSVIVNNDNVEISMIKMDMNNWKKYPALWYGFEIKYPENWKKPEVQDAPAGADWEYRYLFRKKDPVENACTEDVKSLTMAGWQPKYLFYKKNMEKEDPYSGFDMVIYDMEKIKEPAGIGELAAFENAELIGVGICGQLEQYLLENENYPAEKISILSDNNCHNSVFFYSLMREGYLYNLIPALKKDLEMPADSKKEAINDFSEFFSIASSFNLVDIKRPKLVPPKPRISAPKPAAETKNANGRMVCAKKNDKPGKSDKGKGKHLDMECCLDPDEYPNPWCYYSPDKYGKYLK